MFAPSSYVLRPATFFNTCADASFDARPNGGITTIDPSSTLLRQGFRHFAGVFQADCLTRIETGLTQRGHYRVLIE